MIRVWRLCQSSHQASAFTGEGARRYGGRWNQKGQNVVYTAATRSLAALEIFVHVDTDLILNNFVAFAVDIPDATVAIEIISCNDLASNWRNIYPPFDSQLIGGRWIEQCKTAVLAVPSAVIPEENNYLLNPLHPDFAKLVIHPPVPFTFDLRFWK
ncbi:MAG: RES family NAD+ phosphorylase [Methylococcaceae bacterium]